MDPIDPLWHPNPDGEDFEDGGKFAKWRSWLRSLRHDIDLSEEQKVRWINHLKEDVFPFWHRLAELREREKDELMAVFLKYNSPDGILKRYSQEYDEIRARIAAADDADLFQEMADRNSDVCRTNTWHVCDPIGNIFYDFRRESLLGYVSPIDKARAHPRPQMSLMPFAEIEGIPHHHNMNPDDDPSLKGPLLKVLRRLMEDKNGELFINDVDDVQFPEYYRHIERPRCLKFIERGLTSEDSVGYGATAFLTDMSLIFDNCRRYFRPPRWGYSTYADNLEKLMKALLGEMEDSGEKLLAQYDAILSLGPEDWTDPEWFYLISPFNPRLPGYVQRPGPKIGFLRRVARIQFEKSQERVQRLRSLLASGPTITAHGAAESPVEGEAQVDSGSRKRAREEDADASGDDLDRGPKRRRSLRSPTPGPSNSGPVSPRRTSAKRSRARTDDDTGNDAEADKSHEIRSSKRQRRMKDDAPFGIPSSSAGTAGSGSHTVPPATATPKRSRPQADEDSEGGDVDGGDGRGASPSKRRRVMKDAPSTSLAKESTQAGPSTPRQATPEPRGPEPGSAESHLTSPAGQPTPQPVQYPSHYGLPSSKPLKFSRNTITMSKIAKMGKRRPWLFGYKTAEGYGIYAFVSCPGRNCKHHFSSHPLRDHRARDHILACNQPIRDDRDMIRQYARQVVKDADRKSDLTVDWARKSNLNLLPSNLKANHPENFPISPEDE